MGIKKDLRVVLASEDLSEAELARRLEVKPQVLNRKINNQTMQYNEAQNVADLLDYDIIWQKRATKKD